MRFILRWVMRFRKCFHGYLIELGSTKVRFKLKFYKKFKIFLIQKLRNQTPITPPQF